MIDRLRTRGFTLIEVLVALAIFAVMSAAAYRALDVLVTGRSQVEASTAQVQAVAQTIARIERDAQALLPRSRISESGIREPALHAPQFSSVIAWTRAGFAGEADGSSAQAPQRVGYRLKGGTLEYLLWSRLDASPRLEPEATALLTQVQSVRWRFWSNRTGWVEQWPVVSIQSTQLTQTQSNALIELPSAIEVTVTRNNGDAFTRLLPVLVKAS
jgi:general secretion pathway protein J